MTNIGSNFRKFSLEEEMDNDDTYLSNKLKVRSIVVTNINDDVLKKNKSKDLSDTYKIKEPSRTKKMK